MTVFFSHIFSEPDGSWSWRKTGTAICFLVFATACIGYLITHGFEPLPDSYQYIIAGVFAFYFGKKLIEGKKLVVKDSSDGEA